MCLKQFLSSFIWSDSSVNSLISSLSKYVGNQDSGILHT